MKKNDKSQKKVLGLSKETLVGLTGEQLTKVPGGTYRSATGCHVFQTCMCTF